MRIWMIYLLALWVRVAILQHTGPVFLLDNRLLENVTGGAHQALHRTEKTDFKRILDATDNLASTLVFFVEEHFCLEDITQKDHMGTALPNLRRSLSAKKTKFFLNVHEPYELIEEKFRPTKENVFTLRHPDSPIKLNRTMANKYIFVWFDDIDHNEPRMEILRRHDAMVTEVMQELAAILRGPVVGFYFGKFNPMVLQITPRVRSYEDGKKVNNKTTKIKQSFYFLIYCGRLDIRIENPIFIFEKREQNNAEVVTCEANDTSSKDNYWYKFSSYKIYFKVKGSNNNLKWSIGLNFKSRDDKEKPVWGVHGYFHWEGPLRYYNHTNHELATHPHPRTERNGWWMHNAFTPYDYHPYFDPGTTNPPEPILKFSWFRVRIRPQWVRANAKPGEEVVKIKEIVTQWPVYPPDLFVTPAIIMVYIVAVIWFGMLALALKMLMSIKTNDRFDPPEFRGVLHQEQNEDEL